MSNVMERALDTAMDDHLLRLKTVHLPHRDEVGMTTVVSRASLIEVPPEDISEDVDEYVSLDDFANAYAVDVAGEHPSDYSVEIIVEFLSRGRFDRFSGRMARFARKLSKPLSDLKPSLMTPVPTSGARPNYHDVLMSGLAVMGADMSNHDHEAFQDAVRDDVEKWRARALPVTVYPHEQYFHATEVDEGGGAGLYIGRQQHLADGVADKVAARQLPMLSALNFVRPNLDGWYRIPSVPFGMTPGIRGFIVRREHSAGSAARHDLHETVLKDEYAMTMHRIKKRMFYDGMGKECVKGRNHFPVAPPATDRAPVEHIAFTEDCTSPALLYAQEMSLVICMTGRIKVGAFEVEEGERITPTTSHQLQPGGAAIVFPRLHQGGVAVHFSVSSLTPQSSAMLVRPFAFR